jgi:hypothetical protein
MENIIVLPLDRGSASCRSESGISFTRLHFGSFGALLADRLSSHQALRSARDPSGEAWHGACDRVVGGFRDVGGHQVVSPGLPIELRRPSAGRPAQAALLAQAFVPVTPWCGA